MSKSPDAFRTISEVADWLGIQAHVLRFWESKFTQVKPIKRAGGRRYYRPADMQLLGGIRKLLHDDGLTIKGVQKILREEGMSHVAALSEPLDDADAEIPSATPATPARRQSRVVEEAVVLPFGARKEGARKEAGHSDPAEKEESPLIEAQTSDAPDPVTDVVVPESDFSEASDVADTASAPTTPEGPKGDAPPYTAPADTAPDPDDAIAAKASEAGPPLPDATPPQDDTGRAQAPADPEGTPADGTVEAAPETPEIGASDQADDQPAPLKPEIPGEAEHSFKADKPAADALPEKPSEHSESAPSLQTVDATRQANPTDEASPAEVVPDTPNTTPPVETPVEEVSTSANATKPEQPSGKDMPEASPHANEPERDADLSLDATTTDMPETKAPQQQTTDADTDDKKDDTDADETTAASLPSFRRRPADTPKQDATPAPKPGAETVKLTAQPTDEPPQSKPSQNAPPTTPKAPQPRDIGIPPVTPEAQIEAKPAALTSASQIHKMDTATAREVAPLLAQLTALRDRMAARSGSAAPKS